MSDSARQIEILRVMVEGNGQTGVPVQLRLTDGQHRRIGLVGTVGATVNEIPGGHWDAPPGPDSDGDPPLDATPNILISGPASGRYLLELVGVRTRRYFFYLGADRADYRSFGPDDVDCAAAIGRIDSIWIEVRADTVSFTGTCSDPK